MLPSNQEKESKNALTELKLLMRKIRKNLQDCCLFQFDFFDMSPWENLTTEKEALEDTENLRMSITNYINYVFWSEF